MTDETKPWWAEMPDHFEEYVDAENEDGLVGEVFVECYAPGSVLAFRDRCNEELDKLRSELAEWKAKASPHCLDCREYQRACEVAGNHEALEAELAKVRGERDAALTRKMGLAELCASINADRYALQERMAAAGRRAAQQWRPMATAPKEPAERRPGFCAWDDYLWLMPDGDIEKEPWCAYANRGEDEAMPIAWLPLPEPPKEGT